MCLTFAAQIKLAFILVCLGSGLAAFIAQAKYDSFILEVITTVSAVTLAVRVILGYNRMAQRCAHTFSCLSDMPITPASACNCLLWPMIPCMLIGSASAYNKGCCSLRGCHYILWSGSMSLRAESTSRDGHQQKWYCCNIVSQSYINMRASLWVRIKEEEDACIGEIPHLQASAGMIQTSNTIDN